MPASAVGGNNIPTMESCASGLDVPAPTSLICTLLQPFFTAPLSRQDGELATALILLVAARAASLRHLRWTLTLLLLFALPTLSLGASVSITWALLFDFVLKCHVTTFGAVLAFTTRVACVAGGNSAIQHFDAAFAVMGALTRFLLARAIFRDMVAAGLLTTLRSYLEWTALLLVGQFVLGEHYAGVLVVVWWLLASRPGAGMKAAGPKLLRVGTVALAAASFVAIFSLGHYFFYPLASAQSRGGSAAAYLNGCGAAPLLDDDADSPFPLRAARAAVACVWHAPPAGTTSPVAIMASVVTGLTTLATIVAAGATAAALSVVAALQSWVGSLGWARSMSFLALPDGADSLDCVRPPESPSHAIAYWVDGVAPWPATRLLCWFTSLALLRGPPTMGLLRATTPRALTWAARRCGADGRVVTLLVSLASTAAAAVAAPYCATIVAAVLARVVGLDGLYAYPSQPILAAMSAGVSPLVPAAALGCLLVVTWLPRGAGTVPLLLRGGVAIAHSAAGASLVLFALSLPSANSSDGGEGGHLSYLFEERTMGAVWLAMVAAGCLLKCASRDEREAVTGRADGGRVGPSSTVIEADGGVDGAGAPVEHRRRRGAVAAEQNGALPPQPVAVARLAPQPQLQQQRQWQSIAQSAQFDPLFAAVGYGGGIASTGAHSLYIQKAPTSVSNGITNGIGSGSSTSSSGVYGAPRVGPPRQQSSLPISASSSSAGGRGPSAGVVGAGVSHIPVRRPAALLHVVPPAAASGAAPTMTAAAAPGPAATARVAGAVSWEIPAGHLLQRYAPSLPHTQPTGLSTAQQRGRAVPPASASAASVPLQLDVQHSGNKRGRDKDGAPLPQIVAAEGEEGDLYFGDDNGGHMVGEGEEEEASDGDRMDDDDADEEQDSSMASNPAAVLPAAVSSSSVAAAEPVGEPAKRPRLLHLAPGPLI